MNNTDLEKLYNKIRNHIQLVEAYTENDGIAKVIKICRLKPYSIFTKNFQPETKFEDHWVDEFGNSLRFENKIPRVELGSTNLLENTKISTDLFFGNFIRKTAENSKSIFIAKGKFFEKDFNVVALYGQDEYLRAFIFYDEWVKVSPLLLGINTLHELSNHIDNIWFEIDKKDLDFVVHFDIEKCAIISLPVKRRMSLDFDTILNNIYKGEK